MESNIFISFLELLKVKHTTSFSNQLFNEHPHKYNLFGLSSMLSEYGVENTGLRITNKNDVRLIETPFIAHTGSEFVVVEKIFTDEIQFFERDKRIKVPLEDFFKIWTGNILVAEPGQNSVEPEYGIHFREELFNILRKIAIFAILIFLFAIAFISDKSYLQPGLLLLLVISLSGIYIDYLLLLKQLHIQNSYADRLCSLFKYSNCNNILESDDAKLFGVLSWSEVGMGYFISNTIILCFLPY